MDWAMLTDEVTAKILVWVITGVLSFIAYHVWRIKRLIEKHERVLFGDKETETFEGIVTICLSNRKYSITDRKAFIALITTLCKHGVITVDDEFKEAIESLKKYE